MGNLVYLFAAYTIIWTAIFVYMLSIGKKLTLLSREVEILKEQSGKGK